MVYVGCTCRQRNDRSLASRLSEYARKSSHKADLIDRALRNGYQIWVRTKKVNLEGQQRGQCGAPTLDRKQREAQDMENVLLDRYDYKWNIRRNGQMRL